MNPELIQPLIHRHLDGNATPEEASRLALALLEDPAVARAFAQATRLEAGLRTCFQGEVVGRRLADSVRFDASQRRTQTRSGWAAAAASLVVAGLSLAWWRPWARPASASAPALVATADVTPRVMTEAPAPPPSLRRPGALSAAAREVQRLAARYWLPDPLAFVNTPLEEAVHALQVHGSAMNHRQNGIIAGFAIDLPEEVAARPITASRSGLPLGAWLELLSAQAGCDLRFTESGAAFDPVERPEALETRRFPLPTMADPDAPADAPARLFSASQPWDEEPLFRSAPPQAGVLAAAWGISLPARTRVAVKDPQTLEVRHTRRELRRIEGLLAVATADAGRPMVTFRAKEVPLPVSAQAAVGVQQYLADSTRPIVTFRTMEVPLPVPSLEGTVERIESSVTLDDYVVDLTLSPEVMEFEGFINYGTPIETAQQGVAARGYGSGSRVVSNDEAAALLVNLPPTRLFDTTQLGRADISATTTWEFLARDVTVSSLPQVEQEFVLSNSTVAELSEPDPWRETVQTTAPLGEATQLATSSTPPAVAGQTFHYLGFRPLDAQRPPLQAIARLEGEMVKLTGSYTPSAEGGAPTDFQAYVSEGQSFILQTEDAPAARPAVVLGLVAEPSENLQFVTSGLLFGDESIARNPDARMLAPGASSVINWQDLLVGGGRSADPTAFQPPAATVPGVVISPVLQWPSVVAK